MAKKTCAACDRELRGLDAYEHMDEDGHRYCEECWSQIGDE